MKWLLFVDRFKQLERHVGMASWLCFNSLHLKQLQLRQKKVWGIMSWEARIGTIKSLPWKNPRGIPMARGDFPSHPKSSQVIPSCQGALRYWAEKAGCAELNFTQNSQFVGSWVWNGSNRNREGSGKEVGASCDQLAPKKTNLLAIHWCFNVSTWV